MGHNFHTTITHVWVRFLQHFPRLLTSMKNGLIECLGLSYDVQFYPVVVNSPTRRLESDNCYHKYSLENENYVIGYRDAISTP